MSLTLTRQWSVTTHAYQFMWNTEQQAFLDAKRAECKPSNEQEWIAALRFFVGYNSLSPEVLALTREQLETTLLKQNSLL